MEKKILLNENVSMANTKLNQLNELSQVIEKEVIPVFLSLSAGKFTTKHLTDILAGDGSLTLSLLRQQAETDLATIKTPSIRNSILTAVDKSFYDYKANCDSIKEMEAIKMLTCIQIENNKVTFIPGAEKQITEECKVYINSKEEELIYRGLEKICTGCNEFIQSVGERSKGRLYPYDGLLGFITYDNGKFTLDSRIDFSDLIN